MALGLIAYFICHIVICNLGTSCVCPLCSLRELCRYFLGEDRKSRSSDCFSVVASSSIHRFDRALAYDVCSILLVVFVVNQNFRNQKAVLFRDFRLQIFQILRTS